MDGVWIEPAIAQVIIFFCCHELTLPIAKGAMPQSPETAPPRNIYCHEKTKMAIDPVRVIAPPPLADQWRERV